jgi:hypothetical protein
MSSKKGSGDEAQADSPAHTHATADSPASPAGDGFDNNVSHSLPTTITREICLMTITMKLRLTYVRMRKMPTSATRTPPWEVLYTSKLLRLRRCLH